MYKTKENRARNNENLHSYRLKAKKKEKQEKKCYKQKKVIKQLKNQKKSTQPTIFSTESKSLINKFPVTMFTLIKALMKMKNDDSIKEKWPKLRKINSTLHSKPETPELIRKLLKPKEDVDWKSVSSISELSDAFEEFHRDTIVNIHKHQRLSKREIDRLTVERFTSNFRDSMIDLRKELKIDDNILNESIEDVTQILNREIEDRPLPDDIRERTEKILKDKENMNLSPSLSFEDVRVKSRKDRNQSYDFLSGVWRMLVAHCDEENFQVSHPNFNAFREDKPHWLETDALPQEIVDFSKSKCEKWLNEQCEC